jgi:hypothetical protein
MLRSEGVLNMLVFFQGRPFFEKHSINIDTHIYTSTYPYEHTHTHPTSMSTSERLSRLDLEIHKVGHQERLAADGDVASH